MKSPVLALLLALFAANASAQWDTLALRFRTLTIEDGLSQGMVTSIVQDKFGFMWFGTKDGLNRYDGYRFTVYRHDPEDSTTVRDNYITSLLVDREGRLWVGTVIGLDVFDPVTGMFAHIAMEIPESGPGTVYSMAEDHNGEVWAGCSTGLMKLTLVAASGKRGPPAYIVKHVLKTTSRFGMDSDGMLWGATDRGTSFTIRPIRNGRDQLDTLDLSELGTVNEGLVPNGKRSINGVVDDTVRGRHYVIEGSRILERTGGKMDLGTLYQFPRGTGGIGGNSAALDAEGRLMFGFYQGMFRFDPVAKRIQKLVARDPALRVSVENVGCVWRDRSGLFWIGTSGYGVLIYDPKMERFNTVPGSGVHSLSPGNNGKVVVAANGIFVSVYDPAVRGYSLSVPLEKFKELPVMHVISQWNMGSVQDGTGTFWLNYGGLISYAAGDPAPVSHRAFDGMTEDVSKISTVPIFLDGDSLIWLGSESALGRYDRKTSTYRWFPWPVLSNGLPDEQFTNAIARSTDGIFWIGTRIGIFGFDPRTTTWQRIANTPDDTTSLPVNNVFSLALDKRDADLLWAGTNGGGLARIDLRTRKVQRFSQKDGMPNDVVYGILNDMAGRLWLSTNKGISRFDPATGSFRNFDATSGLQSDEFNRYAYCSLTDGTLVFGGVKGFNYFNPKDIVDDSTASPIRITNIKLVNKVLDHREADSPLKAPAYLSQGMTIPMSDNMVTFEFASMEFSAPAEHRYQYKLDGFDKDWIMSGHERTAIYTNLDPGEYTFHVRGDNRDGIWDDNGTSFKLEVLPPWWRTAWFYALCILALGGAVLLYMRRQRNQKQRLEDTVQERTAQLSAAKERAEQSERIKQQFLANMSHEIRTPMNAIVGMSNALRRDAPTDPGTRDRYVDAIASSSENLLGLVNEILDLSKMEAGRLEMEKVRFSPRANLEDVISVMQYRAKEKGLVLTSRVEDAVPGNLLGDPTRLRQVLMNLVGNAIKFTEEGSVEVRMEVAATVQLEEKEAMVPPSPGDPGGKTEMIGLRSIVTDTGIGIAPDRLARVFDEFMQAESDHTRRFGGSGLGLTICQRLVDMQGGTIDVESEVGKGSVFTVNIPYARAAPEEPGGPAEAKQPGKKMAGLHILLVEDNKLNVMVAQVELEDAIPEVKIDVAENGRVALEKLQANTYDLILMDVQMPVMDGYEATRAIRALQSVKALTPILAMTANVLRAEVQQCSEAGMDGFIPKPFKRQELVEAIRRVLGLH